MAIGRADKHDGAVFDEQADEFDGFLERTTAVIAQVNDDAGDVFPFKFLMSFATSVEVDFDDECPSLPGKGTDA